jgi:ABC-type lipoprotein export system ATPase subunit
MWGVAIQLCNVTIAYIKTKYFIPKLLNEVRSHFWKVIEKGDPNYLNRQSNLNTTVTDATGSIESLVNNSIGILRPFFQVMSQLIFIINIGGVYGMATVVLILLIVIAGVRMLYYDYSTRKKLNRASNKIKGYVRNVASNFLTSILNGDASRARTEIVDTLHKQDKSQFAHNMRMSLGYSGMELFHSVLVLSTLYIITRLVTLRDFIVLFVVIRRACEYAWWLFHSINNILRNTAEWGSMEKLIAKYESAPPPSTVPLNASSVIPQFADPNIRELRICGKSAAGKSTWMKRKVIDLYYRYRKGDWLYLEQKMKLPETSRSALSVMSDYLPKDITMNLGALYAYARKLGIENIINATTLHKKFKSPSGGEEKRILFLRAIISIVMRQSHVKVIFCDEVSSGLDMESWKMMRDVIEELKRDYDIIFVTIDHHEFEADINIDVRKKFVDRDEDEEDIPERRGLDHIFGSYQIDEDEEDDDEKNKKELLVWLDGVEPEPNP